MTIKLYSGYVLEGLKMRKLISFATFIFLVACATHPSDGVMIDGDRYDSFVQGASSRLAIAEEKIAILSDEEISSQLRESLSDRTGVILQKGHGIYLEYTSADGDLAMWYPYNGRVVNGSWGINSDYSPPQACFKYNNARHGVTGEYEPNECVSPAQTIGKIHLLDERAGDPFNLSSGTIPYPKEAGNIPIWPDEVVVATE